MVGIYKITSPSGRIYIGQSINIKKRFNSYLTLTNCSGQTKLYNSLLKYTPEKHIFEIIEECEISELNNRERYNQEFYESVEKGLNCMYQCSDSKSGIMSEDSKIKMSKSNPRHMLGKTHSQEARIKISNTHKGRKLTDEHKLKISKNNCRWNKGIPCTEEAKENLRIKNSQWRPTQEQIDKMVSNLPQKVKIIDIFKNKIYKSINEAARENGLNSSTLHNYLSGKRINKTNLRYYLNEL